MALKKFARRDVILPAVIFLLTFVVALFSLRLLSLNQEKTSGCGLSMRPSPPSAVCPPS